MSTTATTLLASHLTAAQRIGNRHRHPVAHAVRQLARGVHPSVVTLVHPRPRGTFPCRPPGCTECRWLAAADLTGTVRCRLAADSSTSPGDPNDRLDVHAASRLFGIPAKRVHRMIARRQLSAPAGLLRRGDLAELLTGEQAMPS